MSKEIMHLAVIQTNPHKATRILKKISNNSI